MCQTKLPSKVFHDSLEASDNQKSFLTQIFRAIHQSTRELLQDSPPYRRLPDAAKTKHGRAGIIFKHLGSLFPQGAFKRWRLQTPLSQPAHQAYLKRRQLARRYSKLFAGNRMVSLFNTPQTSLVPEPSEVSRERWGWILTSPRWYPHQEEDGTSPALMAWSKIL